MDNIKIGIISGSGLENAEFFKNSKNISIETPYGEHSDSLISGEMYGIPVILLARHGRKHQHSPTNVNYRANIWALRELGCTHIFTTTAVGSLREEIKPGDFVIIDQFIDFTKQRKMTFYEDFSNGVVHTAMGHPFNDALRNVLSYAVEKFEYPYHKQGTVVTIEGPRFSTKAESHMFRSWGADIINMSVATEAVLANELNIPYAAIAMTTDYDSWREGEEVVTWEMVLEVFKKNAEKVTHIISESVKHISEHPELLK